MDRRTAVVGVLGNGFRAFHQLGCSLCCFVPAGFLLLPSGVILLAGVVGEADAVVVGGEQAGHGSPVIPGGRYGEENRRHLPPMSMARPTIFTPVHPARTWRGGGDKALESSRDTECLLTDGRQGLHWRHGHAHPQLDRAIAHLGNQKALADALNIRSPSISEWRAASRRTNPKAVPADRCLLSSAPQAGAVTWYDLRPDIFGEAPDGAPLREAG